MSNVRQRLQRIEGTDAVRLERLRTHVAVGSDFEIIAHLWAIPVDRIPTGLLTWPKAQQIECLELLRRELNA